MGRMVVFATAKEGMEAEYEDWYQNTHLHEVLACGPFTAAQRFKVSDEQMMPSEHRYCTIYEFEGPADAAVAALKGGAAGFTPSTASGKAWLVFTEEAGPRVEK